MSVRDYEPAFFRIYVGAMYTGKTREFITDFDRLRRRKIEILAFKPTIDDRFPPTVIKSRGSKDKLPCIAIPTDKPEKMLEYIARSTVAVGIDEMQFFCPKIIGVVEYLRDKGLYVAGTALDLDFKGEPFGVAPILMANADDAPKFQGACTVNGCGNLGNRTQRLFKGQPAAYDSPLVVIDKKKRRNKKNPYSYTLRCRDHHDVPGKPVTYTVDFSQ